MGGTCSPRQVPRWEPNREDQLCYQGQLLLSTSASDGALTYDRDSGIVSLSPADGSFSVPEPIFQSVIGLEVHAQLLVPTKLFSNAPTRHHPSLSPSDRSSTPPPPPPRANELVSPHDMGYPGTLPRISSSAVRAAALSAHALRCTVHRMSRFERKHYAYADLPLGYQVTQQRWPIGTDGVLECRWWGGGSGGKKKKQRRKEGRRRGRGVDSADEAVKEEQETEKMPKKFSVGIDRVQIEQDTGKTTVFPDHDAKGRGNSKRTRSLVDLNRAGCALIEIVFRPDIRSAHEAASAVSTLQQLLRHIGTCDGRMEEGSIRCDLNVSVAPLSGESGDDASGDEDNPFQSSLPPGTGHRVEVKNLNSIKEVIEAAEYESTRQVEKHQKGQPTGRETRTFDARAGKTLKIRSKGGAVDYRFMPEPDLPPLVLNEKSLGGIGLDKFLASLPELPEEATSRLMEEYGLAEDVALVITADRSAIAFYEEAVMVAAQHLDKSAMNDQGKEQVLKSMPLAVANWLCNDLFGRLKESATRKDGNRNQNDLDTDNPNVLNHPISVEYSDVDSDRLGALVALVLDGTISTPMGKKILSVMFSEDLTSSPRDIADARGWKVITDHAELRSICTKVVCDDVNKEQLELYGKGGKYVRKMTKFFVGKVMAESKGNAHPELMTEELKAVLEEHTPGVVDVSDS